MAWGQGLLHLSLKSGDHCNPVITQGEWRFLFLGARRVIVFNLAGTLHAIDDDCPNHSASLFAGNAMARWGAARRMHYASISRAANSAVAGCA